MPKPKILIVEDDRSIADVLDYNLTNSGYETILASDGQDALHQARLKLPDLVILDLMLPILGGLEVCKHLRASAETSQVPIIMLTAKGEETDELVGFSIGADDYVVKPFSVKILLERVKSLLRRRGSGPNGNLEITNCGGVTIDRIKHQVSVKGNRIELTPSEFRLLDTLIRQPGRAFDRSELIDTALGADALVLERTIDVHIRSLRQKLGEKESLIQTVRGIGYRFRENS
jgi:two-component system phosphate regulon response regulator PhoB